MSYRDPDDLTVSRVSQNKCLSEMIESQDEENIVKEKNLELDPNIAAVGIAALALIAIIVLFHFCPPAGVCALSIMVGGTILYLYLKNREEEKLAVQQTESNMLQLRDRPQGSTTQKKTEKARETGKEDQREESDSTGQTIQILQAIHNQFNISVQ